MRNDSVFAVKGADKLSEKPEKYRVNLQAELKKRLRGRKIMEVLLIQVSHPWYVYQTLLRLDDGTVVEIPHLSGSLGVACIEHIQDRKLIFLRRKLANTDDERNFWQHAIDNVQDKKRSG
jgi:hypothetical protein